MRLDPSKSYALWWSGGLDSTLLLAKLCDQEVPFTILQYRQFWTKEQSKPIDELIKKRNLKVFSYPMKSSTFIGKGDDLSIVFEIANGNGQIPIVQDVVEGSRCIAELQTLKMEHEPMKFDVHIVGSRMNDSHWSLPRVVPGPTWTQNGVEWWAPLYGHTKAVVKRELRARHIDDTEVSEMEDTGHWVGCSKCIRPSKTGQVLCPLTNIQIPVVDWSSEGNLAAFRHIYS